VPSSDSSERHPINRRTSHAPRRRARRRTVRLISTTGFLEFETTQRASNIQFDVRAASLVASGIGFIGAGLIFRQGTTVRNLTTAASLWVTAAIGLSCGVGDFAPAIATTLVMLLALALVAHPA
jgi:putative Mg2+ transporter-C (MgtC) family protein